VKGDNEGGMLEDGYGLEGHALLVGVMGILQRAGCSWDMG